MALRMVRSRLSIVSAFLAESMTFRLPGEPLNAL
jgi:hypothetical protein